MTFCKEYWLYSLVDPIQYELWLNTPLQFDLVPEPKLKYTGSGQKFRLLTASAPAPAPAPQHLYFPDKVVELAKSHFLGGSSVAETAAFFLYPEPTVSDCVCKWFSKRWNKFKKSWPIGQLLIHFYENVAIPVVLERRSKRNHLPKFCSKYQNTRNHGCTREF